MTEIGLPNEYNGFTKQQGKDMDGNGKEKWKDLVGNSKQNIIRRRCYRKSNYSLPSTRNKTETQYSRKRKTKVGGCG